MRDDELLEWERQAYEYRKLQRRRTRNERRRRKRRLALFAAFALVALAAAVVFAQAAQPDTGEGKDTAPTENAAEAPQIRATEAPAEEPSKTANLPKLEDVTLTHYCTCKRCCGKAPDHPAFGITASGRAAEPYTTVAVDPHIIPLGSAVYVDYGDGTVREYRADDTGGAIKGAHIDLCVEEHQEALELGVKTVAVWYAAPNK